MKEFFKTLKKQTFQRLSKNNRTILKSFDDLYLESRKIARKWNENKTIPIVVIEEMSKILISNAGTMDLPEMPNFTKEYAKLIRNIVKLCRIVAKRMDSKSVPESLLKEFIATVKDEFIKSSKL